MTHAGIKSEGHILFAGKPEVIADLLYPLAVKTYGIFFTRSEKNGQVFINCKKPVFARNTVDSLTTIRKLKDKGVEVYFEKENIYTFDGKGELLITIMSSLAQEESRSISENVTWGQRKSFSDGKVKLPYKQFPPKPHS